MCIFIVLPSRSMRMDDVMHMFSNLLHQLDDTNIVRVSLLYMLEQRFCEKYHWHVVTKEILAFVSNLDKFNKYTPIYIISTDTYTYGLE